MKQRIVVGLSGGVDSAVSAWLLKRQGHEVVGVFMKNWEDDDRPAREGDDRLVGSGDAADGYCTSNIDFVDAAAVADVIGIELEHVNFAAEYKDRVFAEFLREYEAGRTPNPDVLCNAEIKFKAFLDHALRLGADKIATGHYARVRRVPAGPRSPDEARVQRVPAGPRSPDEARVQRVPAGPRSPDESQQVVQLLKGLDPAKDQSYFLHRLTQSQLARTLFPVGELHKTDVRRIALEIGLPNARKKDSTGICFIGERPFREFLNRYLSHRPGPMLDERGRQVGRHVGLSFYTLGQRQGLGIGGINWASRASPDSRATPVADGRQPALGQPSGGEHAPWFVAAKDLARNTLRVVQGHDHPALLSRRLWADDCSWIAGAPPAPGALAAKARYRQADAACNFEPGDSGFSLLFDAAQWAVTPGQSAVLYDGDVCLGGGVIVGADAPPFAAPAPGDAPARTRARRRPQAVRA